MIRVRVRVTARPPWLSHVDDAFLRWARDPARRRHVAALRTARRNFDTDGVSAADAARGDGFDVAALSLDRYHIVAEG